MTVPESPKRTGISAEQRASARPRWSAWRSRVPAAVAVPAADVPASPDTRSNGAAKDFAPVTSRQAAGMHSIYCAASAAGGIHSLHEAVTAGSASEEQPRDPAQNARSRMAKAFSKTASAVSSAAARAVREARTAAAAGTEDVSGVPMWIAAILALAAAALVIGLTLAFAAAAGGSAQQAGGAGFMDQSLVLDMKREIGLEWARTLGEERQAVLQDGADAVIVRYNPSEQGDGDARCRLDNWNDVFAVWLALNDRVLTEQDRQQVRDIYFQMNPIERGPLLAEGIACLDVRNLRAPDAAAMFLLSPAQTARIEQWISPASSESVFWLTLLGASVDTGAEFSYGYLNVPPGSAAQVILQEAQARAGWIYSQERRTQRGYADCSSLVAACYGAVGIRLGGQYPTAAEIGRFCDSLSCRVPAAQAQPGDIIVWGGRDNNRYLGIYHVALYAGDGMMWEAAPSAGGVVYRSVSVQNPSRILFYARPLAVSGQQWNDASSVPEGVAGSRTIVLSTTAYCEACDTIYGEGRTASGTYPKRGTVATSRTRQFPFGTRLYIPGYGYGTVEDTGGFADGTIDLYLGHRSVCTCGDDWGRRTVTVYVLS